jgi:ketosteroid isomerase-like protein
MAVATALKLEATTVNTVRNGRIIAVDFFWDHAEALEIAGRSEQEAQADS